jgi:AraC-like DNA-binding protein
MIFINNVNINADRIDDIAKVGDKEAQKKNFSEAIDKYSELINIYKANKKEYKRFPTLFIKGGDMCYDACRYIEALEFYTLAMETADKAGDTKLYYNCIGYVGNVYGLFEDYDRALFYFEKGLKASQELNDYDMVSKYIIDIVMASCYLGNTEKAKKYFNLQTKFPMKDNKLRTFYFLFNQGMISCSSKNYSAALFYYKQVLSYAEENNMDANLTFTTRNEIGYTYLQAGCTKEAEEIFINYLKDAKKINRLDFVVNAYQQLGNIYKKEGDKRNEQKYFALFHQYLDSIYNPQQLSKAKNALLEYEDRASTEKIDSLSNKVFIQLIIIVGILLVVGVLIYMVITIFMQKRKLESSYRLLIDKENALEKSTNETIDLRQKYINAVESVSPVEVKENDEEAIDSQIISKDQEELLLNKITAVMKNREIVFSTEFSLTALAREVGSNVKYVSFVINDTYNENFKSFVNRYRLREACRLLKETDEQIQTISINVGYNSSNSFIKIFKKAIGMTPAMYRRLSNEDE